MFLFAHIDSITLPLEDPILKFLLILVIILAAPLLLNKLKIPYLLGLIIAGAVIGPPEMSSHDWRKALSGHTYD